MPKKTQVKPGGTIQNHIAARLREGLIRGDYKPGEALTIRDLAQTFGSSTQPVREAIKQLVAEKALEALPNRSARVQVLNRDKLLDLIRVRIAVEGLAVSLAAASARPYDIRELKAMLEAPCQDATERLARHRDFHFRVYELSGSETLMSIIESLWLQLGPYLRIATDSQVGRGPMGAQFHLALVAALERGDAKAARRALEMDVRRSAELFQPHDLRGLGRMAS